MLGTWLARRPSSEGLEARGRPGTHGRTKHAEQGTKDLASARSAVIVTVTTLPSRTLPSDHHGHRRSRRARRRNPSHSPGTLSTNQEAASTIQAPAAIIRATGHDILRAARIIPRHGPIILAPGVVIQASDPVIQASGSVIRASGFVIRASGAIIQRAGHVFITSVSTIGATGRISPTIGGIRRAIRDGDDAARLSRCETNLWDGPVQAMS